MTTLTGLRMLPWMEAPRSNRHGVLCSCSSPVWPSQCSSPRAPLALACLPETGGFHAASTSKEWNSATPSGACTDLEENDTVKRRKGASEEPIFARQGLDPEPTSSGRRALRVPHEWPLHHSTVSDTANAQWFLREMQYLGDMVSSSFAVRIHDVTRPLEALTTDPTQDEGSPIPQIGSYPPSVVSTSSSASASPRAETIEAKAGAHSSYLAGPLSPSWHVLRWLTSHRFVSNKRKKRIPESRDSRSYPSPLIAISDVSRGINKELEVILFFSRRGQWQS